MSKQHCKSEPSYFKIINKTDENKLPSRGTKIAPLIFKIPVVKIAKAFLGGGNWNIFLIFLKKKRGGREEKKEEMQFCDSELQVK